MALSFLNKVVIVTGASSGIGAATALNFAKLGASVVLTGRNEANLKTNLQKCLDLKCDGKYINVVADLTVDSDVEKIVNEAVKNMGKIDVLVNNAGIINSGSIETTTVEEFDNAYKLNVRSVFLLTKLAMPHLIATKGNVVNVSSVCGTRSFPGILAYGVTKAGVDQFTRCVALETAAQQVRVNAVCPGVIVTELHRRGGMDDARYKAFLEHTKSTHALGRAGQTHEVADVVAFLASDAASFITGATLPVDGGRHAMCPR